MSETPWVDKTGLDLYNIDLDDYLGFIYRITNKETGEYYLGRKQLWNRRGKDWYESDWRGYKSSSKRLLDYIEHSGIGYLVFEVLGIFRTKSAIRYAEAAAIIVSGSYLDRDRGLNWNFAGCKGPVKFENTDEEQYRRMIDELENKTK